MQAQKLSLDLPLQSPRAASSARACDNASSPYASQTGFSRSVEAARSFTDTFLPSFFFFFFAAVSSQTLVEKNQKRELVQPHNSSRTTRVEEAAWCVSLLTARSTSCPASPTTAIGIAEPPLASSTSLRPFGREQRATRTLFKSTPHTTRDDMERKEEPQQPHARPSAEEHSGAEEEEEKAASTPGSAREAPPALLPPESLAAQAAAEARGEALVAHALRGVRALEANLEMHTEAMRQRQDALQRQEGRLAELRRTMHALQQAAGHAGVGAGEGAAAVAAIAARQRPQQQQQQQHQHRDYGFEQPAGGGGGGGDAQQQQQQQQQQPAHGYESEEHEHHEDEHGDGGSGGSGGGGSDGEGQHDEDYNPHDEEEDEEDEEDEDDEFHDALEGGPEDEEAERDAEFDEYLGHLAFPEGEEGEEGEEDEDEDMQPRPADLDNILPPLDAPPQELRAFFDMLQRADPRVAQAIAERGRAIEEEKQREEAPQAAAAAGGAGAGAGAGAAAGQGAAAAAAADDAQMAEARRFLQVLHRVHARAQEQRERMRANREQDRAAREAGAEFRNQLAQGRQAQDPNEARAMAARAAVAAAAAAAVAAAADALRFPVPLPPVDTRPIGIQTTVFERPPTREGPDCVVEVGDTRVRGRRTFTEYPCDQFGLNHTHLFVRVSLCLHLSVLCCFSSRLFPSMLRW